MIIDIHTHPSVSDDPLSPAEEMIRRARQAGIRKLCLLGDVLKFGYNANEEQIRLINDVTITLVRARPEFFEGFCFVNPSHAREFIEEEIRRCVVEEHFKGVKLEVDVNARDSRLDPIMGKAEELDIVVLHHTWYKTVDKAFNESDPSDIADLAGRFPNAKIIMAHLAGCGIRGVLDVRPFGNVYVDTSGGQPVSGMVEYAVEQLGAERILFGSDAPYRDFSCQMGRILGAGISQRDKDLILGLNAERLLG